MKTLREMKGMSLQTMLEHNPYVSDVQQEMMRSNEENDKVDKYEPLVESA